ncbi:MAG TPA: hypothetical protein VGE67_19110 [Haloferula sp.]
MEPRNRYHEHSGVALWISGIFLCLLSAWASGYTAIWGGKAAGLKEGGLNLQFIPFLLGGWICGAIVGLALFAFVRRTTHRSVSVMLVPLLAFGVGAALQTVKKHKDRQRAVEHAARMKPWLEALNSQIRTDPEVAVREKWHRMYHADPRWKLLYDTLLGTEVRFSERQLFEFQQGDREMSIRVLESPSATPEFLRRNVDSAMLTVSKERMDDWLMALIANPNTPEDELERIRRVAKTFPDNSIWRKVSVRLESRIASPHPGI